MRYFSYHYNQERFKFKVRLMLNKKMPLQSVTCITKISSGLLVVLLGLFLAACSGPKRDVPINDRSTGRAASDQAKPTAKVNPVANSNPSVKSDPVKEVKNQPTKTDPKNDGKQVNKTDPKADSKAEAKVESKPETKPEPKPESKVDSSVPDGDFSISRPASGQTVGSYNGGTNKGIDIAGKLGDPVFAGADGKVIFADSFKGYGNTLIVKHNNRFVTVYSHNKTLLVKEGQQIKRGQKIAEMGDSEADRVKLHFEIRRDGKPVDPSGYLQ
jgi:murein DD-endopeptidase MepM/ murein hydrolase activator NlpD